MTYSRNKFKYPPMPMADFGNITNMQEGDRVFNSSHYVAEYYDGEDWTNDDCVKIEVAETCSQGNVVHLLRSTVSGTAKLLKATSSNEESIIGVVHRTGTYYSWEISQGAANGTISANNTIQVDSAQGNLTSILKTGDPIQISSSSNGNNGRYQVATVTWNGTRTIITIVQTTLNTGDDNGTVRFGEKAVVALCGCYPCRFDTVYSTVYQGDVAKASATLGYHGTSNARTGGYASTGVIAQGGTPASQPLLFCFIQGSERY